MVRVGGHWQFFSLVFVGDVFPVWMSLVSGVSSAAASETSSKWLSLGGQASWSSVCPRQEPVVGVWAAGSALVIRAERASGGAACRLAHENLSPRVQHVVWSGLADGSKPAAEQKAQFSLLSHASGVSLRRTGHECKVIAVGNAL